MRSAAIVRALGCASFMCGGCLLTTSFDGVTGGTAPDAAHSDAGRPPVADAMAGGGAGDAGDASPTAGADAGPGSRDAGAGGPDAGTAPWDPAYTSRVQLTISNEAADRLDPGFQIGFPIDAQSLIGAGTRDQLRIVRQDPSTAAYSEIARVIDEYGGGRALWIWFRIAAAIGPGAVDASTYLYFGNNTPLPPPASPADVFDFYDGFEGTTLSGAWINQGGYTISQGELALAYNQHVRTAQRWGPGWAVDFSMRDPTFAARFWGGFQQPASFDDTSPWIIWIARTSTLTEIWPEATSDGNRIWAGAPHLPMGRGVERYAIDRALDRVAYRYFDAIDFETVLPAALPALLSVRFTNESGQTVYISKVRVRRTVAPYPTVAIGPIEH